MGPEFNLRKATHEDLVQINEIYNWAVLNTVATFDLEERSLERAERWFESHLDPYYPLFVVENQRGVTGWGSLSPFHTRPAYKESGEFSIYIAPEWSGKSMGDALLETLCKEARKLGYHTLLGLITATNEKSLNLALKHGFFETGKYREVGKKFEQCLDVIVMQRILA
ncbi:sortase-like acyltransferase [Desulfitobacterium dichloroeliminans LMG P-21439]|uniref:Sortase-like acyltransferase n=1 Tax=Desulfitobacterium dichloroeliminans (strain LMG P-21439 / DCA1) TaxID=871963 RepID=L0F9E4_DESDL|nr:GNAT family N-acetyltransferase [Desulfitobacterium dichloroeliminans]AGA69543.1 sortase-like acyltransferase [Desulfitobacterium dichloroeliminans LMG P-21439]